MAAEQEKKKMETTDPCACNDTEIAATEPCACNDTEMETTESCACSHKTRERTPQEHRNLINRLNRIEGQIRGIKGMVERDAYCIDILTQVAAASAALNSFTRVLLGDHIKTCVTRDILEGKEETVDELLNTLQKLMK